MNEVDRAQELHDKLDEIEQRAALLEAEHCRMISRRLNEIRELFKPGKYQHCYKCFEHQEVEFYALQPEYLCRSCQPSQKTLTEAREQ